jgi:hypothetical protein
VLPAMEGPLGCVCGIKRGLLWRGLGIVTAQIQNFLFPAQGQILFEQALYV